METKEIQVSIVIPTMTIELTQKCVDSLVRNTDLTKCEIIIVANGAPEGMKFLVGSYQSSGVPIVCVWHDRPLGAVPALNEGIRYAKGEFVLLLNDDCEVLNYWNKSDWLNMLLQPFSDPLMAVTGPFRMLPILGAAGELSLSPGDAEYGFILFFCAMIRKSIFDRYGLLDETLKCGVDIDFCMKLRRNGFKIQQVPEGRLDTTNPTHYSGTFPIWHQAEATVHSFYTQKQWKEIIMHDAKILESRYGTRKRFVKTSIVIPTFGDSLETLKKCMESVIANTNLSRSADVIKTEIIVVANGCPESVKEYVESLVNLPIFLIWEKQAIGFCSAANRGIQYACGETIVLLNHDVVILGNQWLQMLLSPIESDSEVGITGPVYGTNADLERKFIMFFCAAIRREVFDQIGMFDEIFNPGGFDDIDYCIRAEEAGWKLVQVPDQGPLEYGQMGFTGAFPIYHMEHHDDWLPPEIFERNRKIVINRYGKRKEKQSFIVPATEDGEEVKISVSYEDENIPKYNHSSKIVFPNWPCAQKKYELIMLQELLKNSRINKVLEIGTYRGGSAMLWAKIAEQYKGHVFCVDLKFDWGPFSEDGVYYSRQVYDTQGYKEMITEIQGDTHDPNFAKLVREKVGSVDLLFIDGDHSYEGVAQDFQEFRELVKPGGYVVFHDIIDSEYARQIGCFVSKFWNEIKSDFEHWEFVDNNAYPNAPANSMGIGVIKIPLSVAQKKETSNYKETSYNEVPKILCFIATKNRYTDTLPLAMQSVIMQEVKPNHLIIYDDNDEGVKMDIRTSSLYTHLLRTLDKEKISWEIIYGARKGQHIGHQIANQKGFDLVWRLDDDEIAKPDVLKKLLSHMAPDVGAVGGAVITEGMSGEGGSVLLKDIYHLPNIQWSSREEVLEVEHLHSTFLYRAGIVDYNTNLSPVAHREETLFSHELKRKGYRLLVDLSAVTYHLKNQGGIRSHTSEWFFEHDEKVFSKKMEDWGYKLIPLQQGLGDHCAFATIIPDLLKKYKHLIIGATYPEVFNDHERVTIIPYGAAERVCRDNVYEYMFNKKFTGHLIDAYREMLGVGS